jgi:hypothetical protein
MSPHSIIVYSKCRCIHCEKISTFSNSFFFPSFESSASRRHHPSLTLLFWQHVPKQDWFYDSESLETKSGQLPTISCPIGMYREFGRNSFQRPGGMRTDGCINCPRGRYGTTASLTSEYCTDACPKGRYRDRPGGKSIDDCLFCPEGTVGSETGLTTKACSMKCTDENGGGINKYSDKPGLTLKSQVCFSLCLSRARALLFPFSICSPVSLSLRAFLPFSARHALQVIVAGNALGLSFLEQQHLETERGVLRSIRARTLV